MAPKVCDTEGDELEVGQRQRCKVRGKFPHSVPFTLMGSSGTMAVRRYTCESGRRPEDVLPGERSSE